jgi:hypothetical protein
VTETVTSRWQEADEAVKSLLATLAEEAARTADRDGGKHPRGRARSRRHRKSTRHQIAEVIRSHGLAPGLRVDRNMVAALFMGHRDLVSDPVLVVAVARACALIAGRKLSAKKAARMRRASIRAAELIASAEAASTPTPPTPPVLAEVVPRPSARRGTPVVVRQLRRSHAARWWLAAVVLLLLVVALITVG